MSNRKTEVVLCKDGKYRTKAEIDQYILENVYDKEADYDTENLNGCI